MIGEWKAGPEITPREVPSGDEGFWTSKELKCNWEDQKAVEV